MEKNYRSKHVFLAIGICIAVSAPFLLIFAPQTVADIIHKKGIAQVFVPSENYTVYGVGLLLLVIAAILISILDIRRLSIILSIACLCLSVIPFWAASQSFKLVSEDGLSYRTLFSKQELSYTWSEVERVIYYKGKQGDYPEYEFFFKDGNQLKFKANAYFHTVVPLVTERLKEVSVRIERE
ncbi:hypothetical protein RRV45_01600 [Bacillus sp. DTU_2020_1000418_1_SI_GHA_SEK_038]|uniref:hypothetical protein n=1 Tax=Bacillus sp. DTU_2020_1000418_1_SI_GHA_SEK_038 TaxID=3077585 RepID=UPI0028EC7E73|nr:hypothetical protein [Bacillus sp. DTU_2020_1000418_1_SI_GHA_SEK_038]WNS75771.1 hypothetical protein RRV45_01600 [Bacillus sp. DTU_2020_1000418_1_SI_GHA_SEK_038]